MGTLGCINDMLRRSKDNREALKQNRKRMQETRIRMMNIKASETAADLTPEQLEKIRRQLAEKEKQDYRRIFHQKLVLGGILLAIALLVILICLLLL